MKYNKLVRDKIPAIIRNKGQTPTTRAASPSECFFLAKDKLWEEVREYADAKTKKERKEELADILEVVRLLARVEKIPFNEIENTRKKKAKERGAFKRWIILEEVV